jgi:hypothetical protein
MMSGERKREERRGETETISTTTKNNVLSRIAP